MVDFQKRDTRRGLDRGSDDGEDDGESGDHGGDDGHDHGGGGHDHGGGGHDHGNGGHDHGGDDGHDHGDHQRHDHDHHEDDIESVGVAVVTVSSSRSLDDDPAGDAIEAAVEADGSEVVTRELIPDDFDEIQSTVDRLVSRRDVNAVVTTGGTGVTPDDVTVEAVRPLFDKELPGFGELFRRFSYDEIGTRVVATRAVGGVADGVPVFCLPGSENAARLGAGEIIVPEVGHLAGLAHHEEEDEE
ncbi:molybdenum cofactor biosynthesis protein B [Halobacteriaceae archaeon GCM10025711]